MNAKEPIYKTNEESCMNSNLTNDEQTNDKLSNGKHMIGKHSEESQKNSIHTELEPDCDWSKIEFDEDTYNKFISYLRRIAEPKYREFANRLIPQSTNMLGIRLPILKKLAKQISIGDYQGFLAKIDTTYFEEEMLRGFLIGYLNKESFDVVKQYITEQVKRLNNWSTCDSFCACLKITKNYPEEMFIFIRAYATSHHTYEVRFFIVMCLNYYLDTPKLHDIEEILQSIQSDEYYINMAIAWIYAEIYLRDKNMVVKELLRLKSEIKKPETKDTNNRQRFIFQKTISKICESRKVSNEEKEFVRSIRK